MPTGYTNSLYHGEETTFEDFVLSCARNFGATIHQRDENVRAKPRLREADTEHYEKIIREAEEKLDQAQNWSPQQAQDAADLDHAEKVRWWEESVRKTTAIRERYEAMLDQVRAWTPPTSDHENLKQFMIEQLESSIKFDGTPYPDSEPQTIPAEDYRRQVIESAQRTITNYTKYRLERLNNVAGANRWITTLYNSLGLGVEDGA